MIKPICWIGVNKQGDVTHHSNARSAWAPIPVYDKATLDAECDALRQDAERWRAALLAYERGVVMSHDGRTGEKDGYITLFLQALRERKADGA